MRDLSITQEYLICAVNAKGKLSGLSTEKAVCFVAAGLLEMQLQGCLAIDKKEVTVKAALPENMDYLKSLYDFINQTKPMKIQKLLEAYHFSFTNKKMNELLEAVGGSLEAMDLIEANKTGGLSGRRCYVPKKEAIHAVIDKVRSELLEDGDVTDDVVALVVLLDKSQSLKTYFSDFERKEIKAKLKKIADTPEGKLVKLMVDYVDSLLAVIIISSTSVH